MTFPGLDILSAALKSLAPAVAGLFRRHKLADTEIAELRAQLQQLLNCMTQAAVQAQLCVRGSPNDPQAQAAAFEAIKLATQAGQEFACLIDTRGIAHDVPPALIDARFRFRVFVTDETNLDCLDAVDRAKRCDEIESATATFQHEVAKEAFRRWGIGVGSRAGRLRGRQLPK